MYITKSEYGYSVVEDVYSSYNKEDCEFYLKKELYPEEIIGEERSIEDAKNSYVIDDETEEGELINDYTFLYQTSNELKDLIKDHPDYPIIYVVDKNYNKQLPKEYVSEKKYGYICIPGVYADLGKITYYNGIFIDDCGYPELIDDLGDLKDRIHDDLIEKYPEIDDELIEETIDQIYKKYKWTDVIKVTIVY